MIAYDSASPQHIPENPEAILCYADGRYAWDHTRFPQARWRTITVTGNPKSDICDFEPGCVSDSETLLRWAEARDKAGLDITVYCDRIGYPLVAAALKDYTWELWLSTLDGTRPVRYLGKPLRAVQYTDRSNLYDESLVYDETWLLRP
jgi:hypothetical protein